MYNNYTLRPISQLKLNYNKLCGMLQNQRAVHREYYTVGDLVASVVVYLLWREGRSLVLYAIVLTLPRILVKLT